MNKRDMLTKGMTLGTLSLIMAGTGGKSVFAEEQSDWRDELLGKHYLYTVHHSTVYTDQRRYAQDRLHVYHNNNNKWEIGHFHNEYDRTLTYPNDRTVSIDLEGNATEFDTLKEAYLYAKELKHKNYG